jgi:NADP-dependent 3-hydroxy acid dehydrogenase YdfG
MESLSGKVVIITGASTGIGAATARSLVGLGCKVTLAARSVDKLESLAAELGAAALCVPTDVMVEADVKNMVARTVEPINWLTLVSLGRRARTPFAWLSRHEPRRPLAATPNQ